MKAEKKALPLPGTVWVTHVWQQASVKWITLPCLVLTIGTQSDRSDADGNEVRTCMLLTPSCVVLCLLTSMMIKRLA